MLELGKADAKQSEVAQQPLPRAKMHHVRGGKSTPRSSSVGASTSSNVHCDRNIHRSTIIMAAAGIPGDVNTYMPSPADAGKSITQSGFKITTRKLPILKAGPIDDMTNKLGIAPPEMIFGDNCILIEHVKSGWNIEFNAFGGLDQVDKTGGSMLKVSYSKEWQQTR